MNSNETERIRFAQWLLERHLAWIAAVEVKAAFVVALDTAMIAGLGAVFIATTSRSSVAVWSSAAAVVLSAVALACIAFAVFPRTKGHEVAGKLVYFGDIGSKAAADYIEDVKSAPDTEVLREVAIQIHRNASIAIEKHGLVQKAIASSFLSGIAWFIAMVTLVKV